MNSWMLNLTLIIPIFIFSRFASAEIELDVAVNPNPAQMGNAINLEITVSNTGNTRSGVISLQMPYPDNLLTSPLSELDGGKCPEDPAENCNLNSGYKLVWEIGELESNTHQTVSISPTIVNLKAADGEDAVKNILFQVSAFEHCAEVAKAVTGICVGAGGTDNDGDGISNACDNCTEVANPEQIDTDGDGFGNICDGDLDNQGLIVNSIDFSIFKSRLLTTDPDADLDGSGYVNSIDFSRFKNLLLKQPGPSGLLPVAQ